MSLSLIIFLLVLFIGVFAAVSRDASWGVVLYISLYFIFPASRWWYTLPRIRYTFFVGLLLVILYLVRRERYTKTMLYFPQFKWLIVMVFLMISLSFFSLLNPEEHSEYLVFMLKQLVFMYVAYKIIDTPEKFNAVSWSFLLGLVYIAYLAHSMGRDGMGRVEGIGMPDGRSANGVAAVLVSGIPMLLAYLLTAKNWQRLIVVILLSYVVNAVILFNSRGAFLGLMAGTFYFSISISLKKCLSAKDKILILAVLSFSVLLFFYLADNVFWQRMGTLETTEIGEGGATRVNFWLAAMRLSIEHPFGLGAGGFEVMSPMLFPESWLNRHTGTIVVHSTWFQALSDFGVVGFLLFFPGLMISNFRLPRRINEYLQVTGQNNLLIQSLSIEAGFIGYLVACTFVNRLYADVFYYFLLFIACFTSVHTMKIQDSVIKSNDILSDR